MAVGSCGLAILEAILGRIKIACPCGIIPQNEAAGTDGQGQSCENSWVVQSELIAVEPLGNWLGLTQRLGMKIMKKSFP